jgi:drug/metabolite transporter (DMT)-like permease
VFGSQIAYVQTIAGVFVSIVMIGDVLQTEAWIALALMLTGLLLVEPRREAELQVPLDRLQRSATAAQRGH